MNIVANLGELNRAKQDIIQALTDKGVDATDLKWNEIANKIAGISGGSSFPEILDTDPLTFVRIDDTNTDGAISIINNKNDINGKTFEYNKNNEGWQTYNIGTNISMNYGDKLQFRSNDTLAMSTSNSNGTYRYFKTTNGIYNCGGTLASLMNNNTTMTLPSYCFINLFKECNITSAAKLPWMNIAYACYFNMFLNCNSLVYPPELPATTIYAWCYQHMFENCIQLINAPELPATTLEQGCYYSMFQGCARLINAPKLPATTLSSMCYQTMFKDCTSLKTVYCYCSSNYLGNSYTSEWLSGVPNKSDCIFYKNPSWTTITRNTSTVPSNWKLSNWAK